MQKEPTWVTYTRVAVYSAERTPTDACVMTLVGSALGFRLKDGEHQPDALSSRIEKLIKDTKRRREGRNFTLQYAVKAR